jgi:hypothetical protein
VVGQFERFRGRVYHNTVRADATGTQKSQPGLPTLWMLVTLDPQYAKSAYAAPKIVLGFVVCATGQDLSSDQFCSFKSAATVFNISRESCSSDTARATPMAPTSAQ